jgi:hypothetical protein
MSGARLAELAGAIFTASPEVIAKAKALTERPKNKSKKQPSE